MSKAIYCDHCEKLFPEKSIDTIELNKFYNEDLEFDLCNDCKQQLEAWFYGKLNVEISEEDSQSD